jgi:hypothetical protein
MKKILLIFLLFLSFSCSKEKESNSESTVSSPTTQEKKPALSTDKSKVTISTNYDSPNSTTDPKLEENQILIGNLIWEKFSKSGLISWSQAKSYCNQLTMRLPSLNELIKSHKKLNGKDSVWSNSFDESDPDTVWILDLTSGSIETTAKSFLNEVRCVKSL